MAIVRACVGSALLSAALAVGAAAPPDVSPDKPRNFSRPSFGIVLGGEGAHALANVGVLKALEDSGIRVDHVVATGFAALIAALYATGHSYDDIIRIAVSQTEIFTPANRAAPDYPPDFPLWRSLTRAFGAMDLSGYGMEKLPIELQLVATDVITGTRVRLTSGRIGRAVRSVISSHASVAPLAIQSRSLRRWDGAAGLVEYLDKADIKILVNIESLSLRDVDRSQAKLQDLQSLTALLAEQSIQTGLVRLSPQDVYVRPDLEGISISDFDRAADLVGRGYSEAKAAIAQSKYGSRQPAPSPRAASTIEDRWRLKEVSVVENQFIAQARVLRDFALAPGGEFGMADLERALEQLYGTGFYKTCWFEALFDPETPSSRRRREPKLVSLRLHAPESAESLPAEALDGLVKALSDPDVGTRIFAVRGIRGIGEKAATAVPHLLQALKDKDTDVRRAVLHALGDIRDTRQSQVAELLEYLAAERNRGLRIDGATTIGKIAFALANAERIAFIPDLERSRTQLKGIPGADEGAQLVDASLEKLTVARNTQLALQALSDFTIEGDIPAEFAKGEAVINGSTVKLELNASTKAVTFLGGNIVPLKRGLNSIGSRSYWLEEKKLLAYESPYKKSYAILVAIDDYDRRAAPGLGPTGYPALTGMVSNARELEKTLIKLGFPAENIFSFYDEKATSGAIESALTNFWPGRKYANADRLFFYFGGHGDAFETIPYLVTYNYEKSAPTATAFLMNDLVEKQAPNLRVHHVLFALDSCYAGQAVRTLGDAADGEALKAFQRLSVIRRDTESRARNMLVAGTGNQLALWENGGIFTTALIEALRGAADLNKDGIIQFEELSFFVRNKVTEISAYKRVKQDPSYWVLDRIGNGRVLFFQ